MVVQVDKVERDVPDHDAVAVGEPVGIVDAGLVDHDTVATCQITNIVAIQAGKDFGMFARDGHIREKNTTAFFAPQYVALALL